MKAHIIELYLSGYIVKEVASKLLKVTNEFKLVKNGYEDIHEALEKFLIDRVGEDAGWIGLGRSRNDHVATALRLKMREELIEILEILLQLRNVIISKAQNNLTTIIPAYTHFQPAQPTTLAHYLLYIEEEITSRWNILYQILKQINRSPLGSGAIVGTNARLNRQREAEMLGFEEIVYNTISATSSRLDLISACSELCNLALGLSRIAEDLILLSSNFIKIIKLPDSHIATSSLMPHKRNAVTMEILRARVSECIGDLFSLYSMYKSLPSGYNLDLQEMNKHYWSITNNIKDAIFVLIDIINYLSIIGKFEDKEILTTDEAELRSISEGKPYRKIYYEIANSISAGSFITKLDFEKSIYLKSVDGSPNPNMMIRVIEEVRRRLEEDRRRLEDYRLKIETGLSQLRLIENELM
jgi:argininosuccinate lyase